MTSDTQQDFPHFFGKHQKLVSVLSFGFFQSIIFIMSAALFYSIITLNWQLFIFGVVTIFLESKIGRCQWYIDYINKYIQPRKYLQKLQIIYEEDIPDESKQRSMFTFHPHSVFCLGLSGSMNFYKDGPMSRMVALVSRVILACPIFGAQLRMWGIQGVNASNMKRLMKEGKNIGLIPGGFEEATLTSQSELRVFIKNRKGFIKYALKNNYAIYPVLVLREHQAFWTFDYLTKFRLFLNTIKIPGIWFIRWPTMVLYPTDLTIYDVVGKAIQGRHFQNQQNPTPQQIEEVHQKYIQELKRLYAKYEHLNDHKPLIIC